MKTPTSVMYGFCKIFTLDSSLINDLTALAFCFEVMTGRYRCLLIKKIYTKIKHLIFKKTLIFTSVSPYDYIRILHSKSYREGVYWSSNTFRQSDIST